MKVLSTFIISIFPYLCVCLALAESNVSTTGYADVPATWTCKPSRYNSGDGCHCDCGAWDPDCDDPLQLVHCRHKEKYCSDDLCYCSHNAKCGVEIGGENFKLKEKHIDLSNSGKQGTIPYEIALLTELTHLDLSNNYFHGPIPTSIGFLREMTTLSLAGNRLNGTFPKDLAKLTQLQIINLGNNNLTGTIPEEIKFLNQTKALILQNNSFRGELPSGLQFLTSLQVFWLGDNYFANFTCNCLLLDWYSQFIREIPEVDNIRYTSCSIDNEYFGIAASNLQLRSDAPCSNVLYYGEESIQKNWTNIELPFSYDVRNFPSDVMDPMDNAEISLENFRLLKHRDKEQHITVLDSLYNENVTKILNATIRNSTASYKSFRRCADFESSLKQGRAFGFRVTWKGTPEGELPDSTSSTWCHWGFEILDYNENTKFWFNHTRLQAATKYDVTITPFIVYFQGDSEYTGSQFVFGPRSKTITTSTQGYAPAITNITIGVVSGRQISISWGSPLEHVGPLKYTEVELRPAAYDNLTTNQTNQFNILPEFPEFKPVQHTTPKMSWTFLSKDISPNSAYLIRLRGTTAEGTGLWSEPLLAVSCPENMMKDGTEDRECAATVGYFRNAGYTATPCSQLYPYGVKKDECLVGGKTIETIEVKRGYWRTTLSSDIILECPVKQYCQPSPQESIHQSPQESIHQSNNSGSSRAERNAQELEYSQGKYCSELRRGIYCFECMDGYKPNGDRKCAVCDSARKRSEIGNAVLLAIVFLFISFLGILKVFFLSGVIRTPFATKRTRKQRKPAPELNNPESFKYQPECILPEHDSQLGANAMNRNLLQNFSARCTKAISSCFNACMGCLPQKNELERKIKTVLSCTAHVGIKIRILFGFFQILYSYRRTFQMHNVEDKSSAIDILGAISSIDLGTLTPVFSLQCIFEENHYVKVLLYTLYPICFGAALCIGALHVAIKYPNLSKKFRRAASSVFLILLFVIYPGVSLALIQTFQCDEFSTGDGRDPISALRADYTVPCVESRQRSGYKIYAGIMIAVYPVGVIVLYSVILYHFRDPKVTNRDNIKFLTGPYKESRYWFEAYELFRKLAQSVVPTFIKEPTLGLGGISGLMPLTAMNLSFMASLVLVYLKPYKCKSDFWFALFSFFLLIPAAELSVLDYKKEIVVLGLDVIVAAELLLFAAFAISKTYKNYKLRDRNEGKQGSQIVSKSKKHLSDDKKKEEFTKTPQRDVFDSSVSRKLVKQTSSAVHAISMEEISSV